MENNYTISLRMSDEEKEAIKALAEREHRSVSSMIRVLIREASTERKAP